MRLTWREGLLLLIVSVAGSWLGWEKYQNAKLIDEQQRIKNGTKFLMTKLEEVVEIGSGGIMPVYADKPSNTKP